MTYTEYTNDSPRDTPGSLVYNIKLSYPTYTTFSLPTSLYDVYIGCRSMWKEKESELHFVLPWFETDEKSAQ